MVDSALSGANQLVAFIDESQKKKPSRTYGIELLPIARSSGFHLPGPAVVNVVYVQHPVNHNELVSFADYDERLARDRYEEALRVFTTLGASRIVATSRSETTRQASAKLGAKWLQLRIGKHRGAASSLAADLEGSGAPPIDPRPLRFDDIAGLNAVCEGVLRNGWKTGKITITQSTTLGVDGDFAGALRKAGFSLGLSGNKAKVTEFVIDAAFAPEVAKALDAVVAAAEPASSGPVFRRRRPA